MPQIDKKLAIFGSTEVRTLEWDKETDSEIIGSRPSALLLYYFREGYEIVILSSRQKFCEWDQCWMDLIPKGNIYHPSENDPSIHGESEVMVKLARAIFERFGLQPQAVRPEYWPGWFYAAQDQGVKTVRDVIPKT